MSNPFVDRLRLVWILAAATPLYAVLQRWNGGRSLWWVALYALGWFAIAVALRRDPLAERLRRALGTRTLQILGVIALVLFQIQLSLFPGHWASFTLLASCVWILWIWALSPTSAALAENVARHAVLLASCGLLLLATEGGLRVLAARVPQNDASTITWGIPVHNNRLGFRERDFETPKPDDVFRVMVLGDSLTWGTGLTENERYSNIAEALLTTRLPGRRIEFLNFAVPGGPTTQERDLLRRYICEVAPDLIVVGFCDNDPQPRRGDYAAEIERFRPLYRGSEFLGSLRLKMTAVLLHDGLTTGLRRMGMIPDYQTALDRIYDPASPEWQEFVRALGDIRRISDGRGLPPPIFIPLLHGTGNFASPDRELSYVLKWTRQGAAAARAAGFQVLNLEPEFMRQGNRNRWVNAWDGHPSRECHEIYARHLADAVEPIASGHGTPPSPRSQ